MFAYISKNADKRIIEALESKGFKIVLLAPFSALESPVDTHADMLLLSVGDTVFSHNDYPIEISGFDKSVKVCEAISSKYPNDVVLNIAIVGKKVLCNTKFASKTVLKYLEEKGFSIHHVSQGYAHCSTLIVDENAIITADFCIYEKAQELHIDALHIESGHISLPPYEYGFIGGSSGVCKDEIYLCGSLSYHPNGEAIRLFCEKHHKSIVELLDAPLYDVGGILFSK